MGVWAVGQWILLELPELALILVAHPRMVRPRSAMESPIFECSRSPDEDSRFSSPA
jgi:hypothetical protein